MANQEFTRAISTELMSVLKPLGFRKRRLTFTRDRDGIVQMIALQKSTSSTDAVVKVTANAGLWLSELAPIRAGIPDNPDIWSAHWQMRVGHLSPEKSDLWWSVGNDDDATAVGAELGRRILRYVLPEMERLSSREAVVQLWRSGAAPGLTTVQRDRYLAKLLGPDG
ncbi:MAG TPA: DUF4304 domain-containing protein [Thermoanaerobaculia bacterium]|jgi:hypothetical protein|nr:DUF4304 domain-containing protein [Thermoanaerobaculia bacterium]